MEAEYHVYILYSPTRDRFYIGHTQNIDLRLEYHNAGRVRSTRPGVPWTLKYYELFGSRSEAMLREKEIKSMKSRKFIEELIRSTG